MINPDQIAGLTNDNRFINPFFYYWNRHFTTSTTGEYGPDRTRLDFSGGATATLYKESTVVSIPDSDIQTRFGMLFQFTDDSTADCQANFNQRIEDVNSLMGWITISIACNIPVGNQMGIAAIQYHGTGGSATVITPVTPPLEGTGSIEVYHRTVFLPTAGTSIGPDEGLQINFFATAGSDYSAYTDIGNQPNATIYVYAIKIGPGKFGSPFTRRLPNVEELLMRRYCLVCPSTTGFYRITTGNTTLMAMIIPLSVPLRTVPTLYAASGGTVVFDTRGQGSSQTNIIIPTDVTGITLGTNVLLITTSNAGTATNSTDYFSINNSGTLVIDADYY